jgi:fumarate reductase subunit C
MRKNRYNKINIKRALWQWGIVTFSFMVIPIIVYYFAFSETYYTFSFSKKQSDWQTFSSYYDGILNPILMSINIFVLIKLSYEVSNNTISNACNELMQNAYSEISKRLYSINASIMDVENAKIKLDLLRTDLFSFVSTTDHLFNNEEVSKIVSELNLSISNISKSNFVKNKLHGGKENVDYIEFINLCDNFNTHRVALIKELQNSILYGRS